MNRSNFARETPNGRPPGPGGLLRRYLGWTLFGAFGIGVAVGIALVAGQLASQPVGITGEPVSATSSLASPPDRPAKRERPRKRAGKRSKSPAATDDGTSAVSSTAGAGIAGAGTAGTAYGSSAQGSSTGSGSSGGSGSGKGSDDDYDDSYDDDSYEDDYDYDDDDDDYYDDD